MSERVLIASIRRDGGTQPRALLDSFVIDSYAEAMAAGAQFPPAVVFFDGSAYWLADGFHRASAAEKAGLLDLAVEIRQGTQRDAVLFSVGTNATHGQPRTNADKRRAATTLLGDDEWSKKSDSWIAEKAAVSQPFVSKLRAEFATYNGYRSDEKREGKDGRLYKQPEPRPLAPPLAPSARIAPEVRETLRDVDLTRDHDEMKKLARLQPEKQAAVAELLVSGQAKDVGDAIGAIKLEAKHALAAELRAKPLPLPGGRYAVIVSDPPWQYDKRAEDATSRGHTSYPTLSNEQICALPVASLAEDNCILWLWTTNAFMRHAYQCLDAWGFEERTILTWAKDRMGMGDWLRGKSEHCILAIKGRPIVTLTNQTTILSAPVREHSRKPDEFYALVESLCAGPKVEMFAREARRGWAAWGAEAAKFSAGSPPAEAPGASVLSLVNRRRSAS